MFNVEIGKRGKGKYLPGFSVWPREKGYHIDDVMELTDPEFFTNPSIVSKYATALDAIRGTKKSGFVTLYRGMSGKEKSAWNQGQLIPQGKFFTNKPTSQFASDIAGEFPELFKFRVAAKDVVETDPGTFQLLNDAILKGHTISSKSIQKHNKGGWVKGSGNRDNVPAFLTPGEYVVSKPMIRDLTSRKASAAAPITHVTHEQNINVDVTNPTGNAIIDALKPVLFGLRHQP